MSDPILSVVIPTYNMEPLLPSCLNSLLSDDEKLEKIEVIVINDGSKDHSLEIANTFKEKYPHTFIVVDKSNGNYGSCVNMGLSIARGKYFKILDADDQFIPTAFVEFVTRLENIDVDMVFTSFIQDFTEKKKTILSSLSSRHLNQMIEVDSPFLNEIDVWKDLTMHKITYKTQFLKQIHYYQTEGISYTDMEYVYYPLQYVRSVYFINQPVYKYSIGRIGQTIDPITRAKKVNDLQIIINRIMGKPIIVKDGKPIKRWIVEYLGFVIAGLYHRYLVLQPLTKEHNLVLKNFDTILEKYNIEIYNYLNGVKSLGIPYIRIWRNYKIQVINAHVYLLLKKIF